MLCDICKVNEATISYTEIMNNGATTEKHLCQACAMKLAGLDNRHFAVQPGGLLANILANMILQHDSQISDTDIKKTNFVCPTCKTTYNEFLKYGKFGCHDCYRTFGIILDPCLKDMHGSALHIGAVPAHQQVYVDIPELRPMEKASVQVSPTEPVGDTGNLTMHQWSEPAEDASLYSPADSEALKEIEDMDTLKSMLKQAVACEAYEDAAKLRDIIREKSAHADQSADAHKAVDHG